MQRLHPPRIFANMWEQLEGSISAGIFKIPEMVADELRDGDDDLAKWIDTQDGLILPFDDGQQSALSIVMTNCGTLVDPESERNRADPFLVAAGLSLSAIVATQEKPRKTPTSPYKVPDACDKLSVRWIDWWVFLVEVGWSL